MVVAIHETTEEFLQRIASLENFKGYKMWTMSMKVLHEELLLTDRYLVENPEAPNEERNYGPNRKGKWFTKEQAEQLNMALMIRTLDFDYCKEKLFNFNQETLQYNYSLFKYVFVWLLECWDPNDEDVDNVICTLLEKMHQENQMFYHWSWYVFPRVLDFYEDPQQKLRFLFQCCVSLNDVNHTWNNQTDHPAKQSRGQRPRPILQLIYRTATFDEFNQTAFEELAARMKEREEVEPGFCDNFWASFKMEMIEGRTSSLWEEAGRKFERQPRDATSEDLAYNMPIHAFMNPSIKFVPDFAKAIWDIFDKVPKIVFTALEFQCYYIKRSSETAQIIENFFVDYLASLGPNEEKPYDERKIRILKLVCRSGRL